ncbi:hypothetical protein H696_05281 [Fonticula alba]|uniref:J domain-containing protein n=1 Tax=Fonticula alba TaxID=691883 RepID=A0A058Z276_FONAL|nr:hypothetical protein H696_05281 [Fonticula alba]KCV68365.1 hypothetical protein H696_05281 [Fonticula alba]|eukprot:XP_009497419.1 hypothetical protein H696_05281 [Fonticula alba]
MFSLLATRGSALRTPLVRLVATPPARPAALPAATAINRRFFRWSPSCSAAHPDDSSNVWGSAEDEDSPFKILGVNPTSEMTTIRRAYYRLAIQLHPDKAVTEEERETNARRFLQVNEAYRSLSEAARSGRLAHVAEVEDDMNDSDLDDGLFRTWMRAEAAEYAANGPGEQAADNGDFRRVDPAAEAGMMPEVGGESYLGPTADSVKKFRKAMFRVVGENWDTLIHDHVERRDLPAAFDTLRQMLDHGAKPTRVTFDLLIRGCVLLMQPAPSFRVADPLTRRLWRTVDELFQAMKDFKLTPDTWTYHEMIRASGKCGRFRRAKKYFEYMTTKPFLLPNRHVYNSMLEVCMRTHNYDYAFEVMEIMHDITRTIWFGKSKHRPDAVTQSLLLHMATRHEIGPPRLEQLPRVVELMNKDAFLRPAPRTARRLLAETAQFGTPEQVMELARACTKAGATLASGAPDPDLWYRLADGEAGAVPQLLAAINEHGVDYVADGEHVLLTPSATSDLTPQLSAGRAGAGAGARADALPPGGAASDDQSNQLPGVGPTRSN